MWEYHFVDVIVMLEGLTVNTNSDYNNYKFVVCLLLWMQIDCWQLLGSNEGYTSYMKVMKMMIVHIDLFHCVGLGKSFASGSFAIKKSQTIHGRGHRYPNFDQHPSKDY